MNQFGLFEPERVRELRPLRFYQEPLPGLIRDAVREGHWHTVVQAPTGYGKTLVSAHLIDSALAKGKRPLFICPAITLVNQSLKAFEREGILDVGVIQADHERTDSSCQVQIASMQTLVRRELPDVDFVIVDEVHITFQALYKWMDGPWKEKIVIGLTATPWTKGMGLHWSKLIIGATIEQLIGYHATDPSIGLTPFTVYVPAKEFDPDLSRVGVDRDGEFKEEGIMAVVNRDPIIANIVSTWQEKGKELPTFLFAVNRAHANHLQMEFTKAGINCGYIDAYSTDIERDRTFRRFRSGEDKIIASVGCLTTGVDEDVRCIIDAGPTRSEKLHVQKIGRGLRPAPNKDRLLILDHAGNTIRLGMVTDIFHDTLDTRDPESKGEAYVGDKKPSTPKKCGRCHLLIPAGKRQCPGCGETVLKNDVMEVDGELVEFDSASRGKKKERPIPAENRQEWYSGFLGIAQERGHSEGWAAHRYREKFNEWPRGLVKLPSEPTGKVRKYDTYLRIRYAKSKTAPQPEVEYHGEF
jgi:DNA repair protein RadD